MDVLPLILHALPTPSGAAVGIGIWYSKEVLRPCIGAGVGIGIWMCCLQTLPTPSGAAVGIGI